MSEFRVVAVTGSGSGSGKTRLACHMLARLPGYAGIKCSTGGMYATVTDAPEVVNEPGKDTRKMIEAGAARAILVSSPREEMGEALAQALVLAGDVPGVVVEGNSACMTLRDVDLFVFVLGPAPYTLKPGSEDALSRADVVIVNEDGDEPDVDAVRLVRDYNDSAEVKTIDAPLDGVLAGFDLHPPLEKGG